MTIFDWINIFSLVVLCGFTIALGMLIVLLWRANRVLSKIDNLSLTFKSFVQDLVPAIVNMSAITTALHAVIRTLAEHFSQEVKSDKKEKHKK